MNIIISSGALVFLRASQLSACRCSRPSLDQVCEVAGCVKQYIFHGENRQFYLMHSKKTMNIINSVVG